MDEVAAAAHRAADARGMDTYLDPATNLVVFTSTGLRRRGICCGTGCRHCPFDHEAVALDIRAGCMQQPAWLTRQSAASSTSVVWQGAGHVQLADTVIVLFDVNTRFALFDQRPLNDVLAECANIGCAVIGVPIHGGMSAEAGLKAGQALFAKRLT